MRMENVTYEYWPKWREKLLPIILATEQRNHHQFTDEIDKALLDERAFLFLADEGFFVLQPISENGIPAVILLFAYGTGPDLGLRYHGEIESLSRQIGARKIHSYTAVKKLGPVLTDLGYSMEGQKGAISHWVKNL